MSRDPFITLGVSENVTQNELYDAYKLEKNKYSNMRFAQGEEGADACRRLEEIEDAYVRATEILKTRYDISDFGELSNIEEAIKNGNINEAQTMLDNEQNRTAKWHYLQSVIFYRKGWFSDSLKQLEFACNLEPDNGKYQEAKDALISHMQANSDSKKNSFYSEQKKEQRSYSNIPPQGTGRGVSPCDCCSSLICADCCCECAGGDLISCC